MKVQVNAKSLKDKLNLMPMSKMRGCNKSNMRLRWILAFYESKITGEIVEYEVGMSEIKI